MTALNSYSTGTVSVADGGTTVTGATVIWSDSSAKPGDILQIGNFQTVITDVTDATHLVIPPWGGGAQSGAAYKIWQVSPRRFAGADAMTTVNKLVAAFNTSGYFVFVGIDETDPDPSLGDDGQFAFQPTTGKTWEKVAGVWSYLGVYKAFRMLGAWSGAIDYVVGDLVTLSGSSYVCVLDHTNHTPPNTTYWQLLASIGSNGSTGATGAGYGGTSTTSRTIGTGSQAFTTQAGLAYTNGARVRASSAANTSNWMEGLATYSGTTLTINVDKTGGSGTHADWNLNVTGEPGAGDLLAANNLSDLASAATAATNLGVVRYGGSQSLSAGQQTQARSNIGAALAPTTFSAPLGADVALTTMGSVYTAVSVSTGTTGKFLVTGYVTVVDPIGSAKFVVRISDGVSVFASAAGNSVTGTANLVIPISAIVTNPSGGALSLQVVNTTRNGGAILWNVSGQSAGDTRLDATRIA